MLVSKIGYILNHLLVVIIIYYSIVYILRIYNYNLIILIELDKIGKFISIFILIFQRLRRFSTLRLFNLEILHY